MAGTCSFWQLRLTAHHTSQYFSSTVAYLKQSRLVVSHFWWSMKWIDNDWNGLNKPKNDDLKVSYVTYASHKTGVFSTIQEDLEELPPNLCRIRSVPQQTTFCVRLASRRKFRSQTSDNMDRWKAETGIIREEKRRRKKIKKRKSPKKEEPGARKGRKVAEHCVFPMICNLWLRRVEK